MRYLQYPTLELAENDLFPARRTNMPHTSETTAQHSVSVTQHKLHYPTSIEQLNVTLDTLCRLGFRDMLMDRGLITLALRHKRYSSYAISPLTADGYAWLMALLFTIGAERDSLILMISGIRSKAWKGSYVERSCAAFTSSDSTEEVNKVIDHLVKVIEAYYMERCRWKMGKPHPPIVTLLQNDQLRPHSGW